MVHWGRGYGATAPSHLILEGTGPLCTAFSSARHLQRRSTSSDFHVNRRVLLHAANLRHGTDGFTSPPKEGMLWIFIARKIRLLRPGSKPRSWVPEASMLTTRPPKPLTNIPNDGIERVSRKYEWTALTSAPAEAEDLDPAVTTKSCSHNYSQSLPF
jgi:hypothetical protein